jgi:molecular chaperone DnaK (HSP70)
MSLLNQLINSFHSFRIGDAAKNAYATNPENTVFDAKRLIGRKIDDTEIKKYMKHWPFGVVEKSGRPHIKVQHKGGPKEFVCRVPDV